MATGCFLLNRAKHTYCTMVTDGHAGHKPHTLLKININCTARLKSSALQRILLRK